MFTIGHGAGIHAITNRRLIEEENVASEDRLRELEEKYEDYKVYDNQGQKIGKVDDLFIDESDREEYIGVKMGFFGMKSTLIPMEIVRVNENERSIEVSDSKDHVKAAPSFDDDEDITSEYEGRIRDHFGLESLSTSGSNYGAYADSNADSHDYDDHSSADTEHGERAEGSDSREVPEYGGAGESSDDREESTEAGSGIAGTSSSDEEATREVPTTRQREETETYKEGGRTKVRRRVVREEIFEEGDDQNARS